MKQLYLFENCKPNWSLLRKKIIAPKVMTEKKKLKQGICDHVACMLVDRMVSARILQDNKTYRLINGNYAVALWTMDLTPANWFQIEHMCLLVQCKDQRVLVDIPMREYTIHDKVSDDDIDMADKWFYISGRQPSVNVIRTRNNLMEAYEIKEDEANHIVEMIRDCPEEDVAYYVNMTSVELINQF